MHGVQKMNLKELDEADQKELETVASLIFSYLEKEKKLKGREIFRAVSVEHTNLLAEYQSIFPETDEDFENCVRDGWIDVENCKALPDSYKALENLADIGDLSNHPVHIKDSRGNLNPSSFIPFCRVGGKMVSDRNLFPVQSIRSIKGWERPWPTSPSPSATFSLLAFLKDNSVTQQNLQGQPST